jgi:Zn-finger protein
MGYLEWFVSHAKKHGEIVERLSHLSDDEVIKYFRYENMRESEPQFCPLYAKGKKCHDMENLNCYLCACPYFRFDDEGLSVDDRGRRVKSLCSIESKNSSTVEYSDIVHLDCSLCNLPHREGFIKKHFSRDWFEVMRNCELPNPSCAMHSL